MSFVQEEVWLSTDNWIPITGKTQGGADSGLYFTMLNMLSYFISRKALDGKPDNDFKNLNSKAFPLFKAGHIQSVIYNRYDEKVLVKCVMQK